MQLRGGRNQFVTEPALTLGNAARTWEWVFDMDRRCGEILGG